MICGTGTQEFPRDAGRGRRVRLERHEELNRVDAALLDRLGVADLLDDLGRVVAASHQKPVAGHGRQVAHERRHRHPGVEHRGPHVGVVQVLGLQRLARQVVLA
jgi:hypothetical protein